MSAARLAAILFSVLLWSGLIGGCTWKAYRDVTALNAANPNRFRIDGHRYRSVTVHCDDYEQIELYDEETKRWVSLRKY